MRIRRKEEALKFRLGRKSERTAEEYQKDREMIVQNELGSGDWHSRLQTMDPKQIERCSMEIIREELMAGGTVASEGILPVNNISGGSQENIGTKNSLPWKNKLEEKIVLRVIHATADLEYAKTMAFHPEAADVIKEAIRSGARIVTDTNMARMGINRNKLAQFGGEVLCFMADPAVAEEASGRGITRAAVSMEHAAALPGQTIYAIGNAPTALIRLRELIDEGYRPAAIIGVPVGFVNVVVSKELIMDTDVPWIVNRGRKGGSGVAAAICNAIIYDI